MLTKHLGVLVGFVARFDRGWRNMAGPNMELFRFGLYVWARNILKPDICFSRLGSWCTLVTRSGTTNTYSQYVAPCAPLTSQIRGRFEPPETDFVRKLLPG